MADEIVPARQLAVHLPRRADGRRAGFDKKLRVAKGFSSGRTENAAPFSLKSTFPTCLHSRSHSKKYFVFSHSPGWWCDFPWDREGPLLYRRGCGQPSREACLVCIQDRTAVTRDEGLLGKADPNSPDTQIGPVATRSQMDCASGYIGKGIAEGCRLVVGGPRKTGGASLTIALFSS